MTMTMTMVMMMVVVVLLYIKGTSADDIPQQVHIALAGSDANGNSDRMSISWQTEHDTRSSMVMYGEASGVYTFNASGVSSSYYATYDHHVKTDVLKPNTKYYYRVGDDISGLSKEMTFTSAKTASSTRGGFSFAVFADLGVVNGKSSNDFITSIKGHHHHHYHHHNHNHHHHHHHYQIRLISFGTAVMLVSKHLQTLSTLF